MSVLSSLGELEQLGERLAFLYLRDYTTKQVSPAGAALPKRKEVNDALWGTISLTPLEVVLLDSPLLQRLRYIRQLGAAHWVYPGAVHSRFEHTLGTIHQAEQLVKAINSAAALMPERDPAAPDLIGLAERQLIRMAATLKDVGQLAFSSASAEAFANMPNLLAARGDFAASHRDGDMPGLVQILGYYIVRSKEMRRLLDSLIGKGQSDFSWSLPHREIVDRVVDKVSLAIVGRKINDQIPLLHELVCGPFDASRLDSVVRDARFSGIPSVLDIQRLLQKVAVSEMPAKELPTEVAQSVVVKSENDLAYLTGVRRSASSVLSELQLANVLVLTKITHHAKTVAVEQMLHAAIHGMVSAAGPIRALEALYRHSDDMMLCMNQRALKSALNLKAAHRGGDEALAGAARTLESLRHRRLFVRAFQFPDRLDRSQKDSNLAKFRDDLGHPQSGLAVMAQVRDVVHEIALAFGMNVSRAELDGCVIACDLIPRASNARIGRTFLIHETISPARLDEQMREGGSWVEQYLSDQPTLYVFAPAELADAVYLAFEKVALIKYEVRLPWGTRDDSKRNKEAIKQMEQNLPSTYWQGLASLLRPSSKQLQKAHVPAIIKDFDAKRHGVLEPPVPPEKHHPLLLEKLRTKEWLRQFPEDGHADCALEMLKAFRVLSRNDTSHTFRVFFERFPHFKQGWVVGFGSAKDSGNLQAYFSEDATTRAQIKGAVHLDDYLRDAPSAPLIFVDDFIGSGNQASDILAAWLGKDKLRKSLGEPRNQLPRAHQMVLRNSQIGFVFLAGWSDGVKALEEQCKLLKLNVTVYCHLQDDAIPTAERCLMESNLQRSHVQSFLRRCEEIGAQLVKEDSKRTQDPAILEQRELGYGNKGLLLATPLNVPSQTLTAIWMNGTVDSAPWSPLLRRRKKN